MFTSHMNKSIFTELHGSVLYRVLGFDIMHAKVSVKSLSLPAIITVKACGNYDLTLIYTQQIRELLINTTFISSGRSTRWWPLLSTRLCQVITYR